MIDPIEMKQHIKKPQVSEYFIDSKNPCDDKILVVEGESSSIHNTNNNSMNFSNIFNQMNESNHGLLSEEKLQQIKR